MFITLKVKVGREVLGGQTPPQLPPPLPLFDDRPERNLKFLEDSGVFEDIQQDLRSEAEIKPFLRRMFDTWRIRLL